MTTLKAARLQFFFMQHEKPFLTVPSALPHFRTENRAPLFLKMLLIKASGKIPAPPP
jgi:hypothetical protein